MNAARNLGMTAVINPGAGVGCLYQFDGAPAQVVFLAARVPLATLVTATTTVSTADLSRFVALAHKGLREPFEATYRFVPPAGQPDRSDSQLCGLV